MSVGQLLLKLIKDSQSQVWPEERLRYLDLKQSIGKLQSKQTTKLFLPQRQPKIPNTASCSNQRPNFLNCMQNDVT